MQHGTDYLTPVQVEREYHLPVRTLERKRREGGGPRYVKAGRRVLYRRSDVEDWLDARSFESTADARRAGVL